MNVELEKLMDYAFADGVLTDKEKQVLYKKAQEFEVDMDEFEMVLDGRLHLVQKKSEAIKPKNSNKHGKMRKCPSCGAMVISMQANCPECNHEFSDISANNSIERLFSLLNGIENQRVIEGTGSNPLKELGLGYVSMMLPQKADPIVKKKIEIIANFPIPATKSDILEFLIAAAPKIRNESSLLDRITHNPEAKSAKMISKVWKRKCKEILLKADVVLRNDKDAIEIINNIKKQYRI